MPDIHHTARVRTQDKIRNRIYSLISRYGIAANAKAKSPPPIISASLLFRILEYPYRDSHRKRTVIRLNERFTSTCRHPESQREVTRSAIAKIIRCTIPILRLRRSLMTIAARGGMHRRLHIG